MRERLEKSLQALVCEDKGEESAEVLDGYNVN
jgi:hypothetical protein